MSKEQPDDFELADNVIKKFDETKKQQSSLEIANDIVDKKFDNNISNPVEFLQNQKEKRNELSERYKAEAAESSGYRKKVWEDFKNGIKTPGIEFISEEQLLQEQLKNKIEKSETLGQEIARLTGMVDKDKVLINEVRKSLYKDVGISPASARDPERILDDQKTIKKLKSEQEVLEKQKLELIKQLQKINELKKEPGDYFKGHFTMRKYFPEENI